MMKVSLPDPEVPVKKTGRRLTASYKLKIFQEADNCTEYGQMGALLRREGLYSSIRWRRQNDQGILTAMTPKKRGRKPSDKNPLIDKVAALEKENHHLRFKGKIPLPPPIPEAAWINKPKTETDHKNASLIN